jgi:hypothetical protein
VRKGLVSLLGFAAALFAGFVLLTSLAPGSSIATWAPCPRNWAWAPAWLPRTSPLAAVRFDFEGGHGKVCYGRPSLRGRRMLGGEAVPWGELWRTGANEATTLHLDAPARLGPLPLLPGSYALYTVPAAAQWLVIVNRSTRQWGLESEYTDAVRAHEVGRFAVPVETLTTPVETFTIRPVVSALGARELVLEWERTRVRLPLAPGLGELTDEAPELSPEDP